MTRSSDALGKWRDVDAEGAGVSQCNNDLPSAYLLHSRSHGKWSIEKMVIFHGYVSHNQRVYIILTIHDIYIYT